MTGPIYKCEKCGFTTRHCKDLEHHVETKHDVTLQLSDGTAGSFTCPECGIKYANCTALTLHMKFVHGVTSNVTYSTQNPNSPRLNNPETNPDPLLVLDLPCLQEEKTVIKSEKSPSSILDPTSEQNVCQADKSIIAQPRVLEPEPTLFMKKCGLKQRLLIRYKIFLQVTNGYNTKAKNSSLE